ncbi:Hypothetical_protein [Hexamita inflata]|uniref:Hypothetical_protein n=1 Tax=Hexamita inflata TaxID=28002 RepID=A0AA86RFG9_9EUKA|nr:Hypothetical protein HINF_LOCUS64656 [Hexamita inflata]
MKKQQSILELKNNQDQQYTAAWWMKQQQLPLKQNDIIAHVMRSGSSSPQLSVNNSRQSSAMQSLTTSNSGLASSQGLQQKQQLTLFAHKRILLQNKINKLFKLSFCFPYLVFHLYVMLSKIGVDKRNCYEDKLLNVSFINCCVQIILSAILIISLTGWLCFKVFAN